MGVTPKQTNKVSRFKQNDWYSYYAGYSDEFVYECLNKYVGKECIVLDPWNGAGTTTLCCYLLGIKSIGLDLNPVMSIIANAKLFHPYPEFRMRLKKALVADGICMYPNDPLEQWFSVKTVSMIRSIENSICKEFSIKKSDKDSTIELQSMNIEASYVFLLLFLSIREYGKPFIGSNPTWIKKNENNKVSISEKDWISSIEKHYSITSNSYTYPQNEQLPQIIAGDSKNIPLQDGSVQVVMTSPPYCTRIDYAVYTLLELAIIGIQKDEVDKLRNQMIGSPTIHKEVLKKDVSLDLPLCRQLLNSIEQHASKAAQSYYFKTFKQYILEMESSLKEISRVLAKDGIVVIVVQDSWFKDIYVDVPSLIMEVARKYGLQGEMQRNPVKQSMIYINSKSRKYKKDKTSTEAVIYLRKDK